jgi:hypothetical protein
VEYAHQKIMWPEELNPRLRLWYHARGLSSARLTIKLR